MKVSTLSRPRPRRTATVNLFLLLLLFSSTPSTTLRASSSSPSALAKGQNEKKLEESREKKNLSHLCVRGLAVRLGLLQDLRRLGLGLGVGRRGVVSGALREVRRAGLDRLEQRL